MIIGSSRSTRSDPEDDASGHPPAKKSSWTLHEPPNQQLQSNETCNPTFLTNSDLFCDNVGLPTSALHPLPTRSSRSRLKIASIVPLRYENESIPPPQRTPRALRPGNKLQQLQYHNTQSTKSRGRTTGRMDSTKFRFRGGGEGCERYGRWHEYGGT